MSAWVSAILVDEDGKVCGTVGDETIGRAFRRGWRLLVDKMSVENPPGLTLTLSTELVTRHKFTSHYPIMREFGSVEMKATHLSHYIQYGKCLCSVCGWDEARKVTTLFAVSDPFGMANLEPDIQSLVADETTAVFYAPHPQIKVECGMCVDLRAKGINPITMQPEGT
jgi:hypothetical protein